MKLLIIFSFLSAFALFVSSCFAQVQYYGINTIIDEKGASLVNLTITFTKPEKNFQFSMVGRMENFKYESNAGLINCSLDVGSVSLVNCNMNLTQEKRTIDLGFTTNDYVKILDKKYYFDADFSLNHDINEIFASIKLPVGTGIVAGAQKILFPENVTLISDGRSTIVIWKIDNVRSSQPLRFQILYEQVQPPPLFSIRLRYFVIFGATIAILSAYFAYRYLKKPEKLILSVLDEFERKVMDVIVAAGGEVNQKKIVQETNLSKAKVSRVVKSLVNRGIVEVQRMGRTNKIKLLKKKFSL